MPVPAEFDPKGTVSYFQISEDIDPPADWMAMQKLFYKYLRDIPEGEMITAIAFYPIAVDEKIHVEITTASPQVMRPRSEIHKTFCDRLYACAVDLHRMRASHFMLSKFNPEYLRQ